MVEISKDVSAQSRWQFEVSLSSSTLHCLSLPPDLFSRPESSTIGLKTSSPASLLNKDVWGRGNAPTCENRSCGWSWTSDVDQMIKLCWSNDQVILIKLSNDVDHAHPDENREVFGRGGVFCARVNVARLDVTNAGCWLFPRLQISTWSFLTCFFRFLLSRQNQVTLI